MGKDRRETRKNRWFKRDQMNGIGLESPDNPGCLGHQGKVADWSEAKALYRYMEVCPSSNAVCRD
jgi:hypothetical protein